MWVWCALKGVALSSVNWFLDGLGLELVMITRLVDYLDDGALKRCHISSSENAAIAEITR